MNALISRSLTLAISLVAATAVSPAGAQTRAFTDLVLIDGTSRAPVADATVVVSGGRVVAAGPSVSVRVPEGAERISLGGRFVIPGLINSHGHVNTLSDLDTYAAYGVTTVASLGGESPEVIAGRRQRVARPRSRHLVAGAVIGGATAAAAAGEVAANAALGVDIIKIRVDDNLGATQKMPEDVWRMVIDEAHRRGLRVAAHVYYLDDARRLLEAGVDFIAHSVRDREVDEAFIESLRRHDVCTTPTLMREVSTFIYETVPDFFSDPLFLAHANSQWITSLRDPARQESLRNDRAAQSYKASLVTARRNLARIARGGATIAMGTDTGPVGRFQGYFELMELELMVEAGLTPAEAIRAATGDAARCLRMDGTVGTVEPGKWADFVVLDGDPTVDISAVRRISSVWIGGERATR